jgi:peptidoglycan hydrolase-like protein with peptidoglycan-binding domain
MKLSKERLKQLIKEELNEAIAASKGDAGIRNRAEKLKDEWDSLGVNSERDRGAKDFLRSLWDSTDSSWARNMGFTTGGKGDPASKPWSAATISTAVDDSKVKSIRHSDYRKAAAQRRKQWDDADDGAEEEIEFVAFKPEEIDAAPGDLRCHKRKGGTHCDICMDPYCVTIVGGNVEQKVTQRDSASAPTADMIIAKNARKIYNDDQSRDDNATHGPMLEQSNITRKAKMKVTKNILREMIESEFKLLNENVSTNEVSDIASTIRSLYMVAGEGAIGADDDVDITDDDLNVAKTAFVAFNNKVSEGDFDEATDLGRRLSRIYQIAHDKKLITVEDSNAPDTIVTSWGSHAADDSFATLDVVEDDNLLLGLGDVSVAELTAPATPDDVQKLLWIFKGRLLKSGSRKTDAVTALQRLLLARLAQNKLTDAAQAMKNATKDKTGIDGDFGRKTKDAVAALQKHWKIQVDGVVGNQTLTSLMIGKGDHKVKPSNVPAYNPKRRDKKTTPTMTSIVFHDANSICWAEYSDGQSRRVICPDGYDLSGPGTPSFNPMPGDLPPPVAVPLPRERRPPPVVEPTHQNMTQQQNVPQPLGNDWYEVHTYIDRQGNEKVSMGLRNVKGLRIVRHDKSNTYFRLPDAITKLDIIAAPIAAAIRLLVVSHKAVQSNDYEPGGIGAARESVNKKEIETVLSETRFQKLAGI